MLRVLLTVLLLMSFSAVASAEKLYWASRLKIQRSNPDGTNVEDIIHVDDLNGGTITDLEFDLSRGKMYFVETSLAQIYRANLDGSDVEIIIDRQNEQSALSLMYSLALDPYRQRIYWSESSRRLSANYDGSSVSETQGGDTTGALTSIRFISQTPIPAISSIGLVILVGGIIVASGLILRRRKSTELATGHLPLCE